MIKNLPGFYALACLTLLAGCGGSGTDSQNTSATKVSELEGTWIAATDRKYTGGACGLDLQGNRGERTTITFSANRFSYKEEACVILTGNTGSYLATDSVEGTFAIGGITQTSSDPNAQMRALDLIASPPVYTSYNLVGNKLRIAIPFQTYDGTTRERRAFQIGSYLDTTTRKLVSAPEFIKQ